MGRFKTLTLAAFLSSMITANTLADKYLLVQGKPFHHEGTVASFNINNQRVGLHKTQFGKYWFGWLTGANPNPHSGRDSYSTLNQAGTYPLRVNHSFRIKDDSGNFFEVHPNGSVTNLGQGAPITDGHGRTVLRDFRKPTIETRVSPSYNPPQTSHAISTHTNNTTKIIERVIVKEPEKPNFLDSKVDKWYDKAFDAHHLESDNNRAMKYLAGIISFRKGKVSKKVFDLLKECYAQAKNVPKNIQEKVNPYFPMILIRTGNPQMVADKIVFGGPKVYSPIDGRSKSGFLCVPVRPGKKRIYFDKSHYRLGSVYFNVIPGNSVIIDYSMQYEGVGTVTFLNGKNRQVQRQKITNFHE